MSQTSGKLQLSLNVTERILVIEASSPFDSNFAEEYQRQLIPLRNALVDKAWASMAVISGDNVILAPEIRQFLVAAISQARNLGLCATCLILPENCSEEAKVFWHQLYEEAGVEYQLVSNRDDAFVWLTLRLSKVL
ncbi:MAG: hypothetical protein GJ680_17795 [Alteromonadaceae bacterium]|nr:hypothetical protein [Alteromonadaceae bacterium]